MAFIDDLDGVDGKPAAVFCTYKTAVGQMLAKMSARLRARGATVTGEFRSRGPVAADDFAAWIERLG
jgi:hypothetical protein